MKIGILGMGYVGVTTAACLLNDGHYVVGVDTNVSKVNWLNSNNNTFSFMQEDGVEESLFKALKKELFKATIYADIAMYQCDIIFICVGTPSNFDGSINLSHIRSVIKDIGGSLTKTNNRPLLVVRSTCLPGTMENVIKPLIEEESGLKVGEDMDLIFHPEFLREGTAMADFIDPPKIVVGESRDGASDLLLDLYDDYQAPCFKLSYGEAEMVKYCDNLFHALKITFANEVASISHSVGVDSRKVAEVYCSDKKLNISDTYLYPGNPYGGSCLPKDLKAILRFAELNYLQIPMLKGVLESNDNQIKNLVNRVLSHNPSQIGMVGVAFKEGTNDMRNSPYVEIAKSLIGEGLPLQIYDPLVNQDNLIGSNKKQFHSNFRNIDRLLVDSIDRLICSDIILINQPIVDADRVNMWLESCIRVIDLTGIDGVNQGSQFYEGIYW